MNPNSVEALINAHVVPGGPKTALAKLTEEERRDGQWSAKHTKRKYSKLKRSKTHKLHGKYGLGRRTLINAFIRNFDNKF